MKTIQKLIDKAHKSKLKHDSDCDDILLAIWPMLSDECPKNEMSVFWQQGDGLVLQYDLRNIPVDHIVDRYTKFGIIDFETLMRMGI